MRKEASSAHAAAPTTRSRAPEPAFDLDHESASLRLLCRDLARSRELVGILTRKEFFVRYRRASFGVVWSVVLPLVQAAVLALVLGRFTKFDTGRNYVVFVFAGTIAWTFVLGGIQAGVTSVVDNSGLSSKIYFPRLVFPLVVVLAGVYGTVVSLVVLLGLAVAVGEPFSSHVLLVIPAMIAALVLTAAFAAVLSVAHVYFRDAKWLLAAVQLPWFYLTPIVYPLNAVGRLRPFVVANPVTGVVELFRASVGTADVGWESTVVTTVLWSLVLSAAALSVHRRYDRVMVDLL